MQDGDPHRDMPTYDDPDFQQLVWLIAMTATPCIKPSRAESDRCYAALDRIHKRMFPESKEMPMPKGDSTSQPDKADVCARCGHYRGVHGEGACNGPGRGDDPTERSVGCDQNCEGFVWPPGTVLYRRAEGRPQRRKPES